MSGTEQVRPEVVAAIVTALQETDPSNLPADATRAEKDAAKDQYLSGMVAERAQRDRQPRRAAELVPVVRRAAAELDRRAGRPVRRTARGGPDGVRAPLRRPGLRL